VFHLRRTFPTTEPLDRLWPSSASGPSQARDRQPDGPPPSCWRQTRPDYPAATPDVVESEKPDQFYVLSLEALVRMKLTSFRLKDRVHLQDLMGVGLLDASWADRLPPELAARLRQVIEAPEE